METIILLKVLAINYPILQHWGISFSKCITVVVAEDKTVEVKELLKNFHSPFGKIKNSDFRFYFCSDIKCLNKRANEIQQELLEGIQPEKGFPIIITDNVYVEDIGNNQFLIFLDEKIEKFRLENTLLYPENDCLNQVKRAIDAYEKAASSNEEFCLLAAKSFVPRRAAMVLTSEKRLEETVHLLCRKNEEARDAEGLAEMFVNCLYSWQEKEAFDKICTTYEAQVSQKETYIFFDTDFLYLSSNLFRKITSPLTRYIAITSLKLELVKRNILIPEKSASTFTVKMTGKNEHDIPQRIRMLRINREKIDRLGELSFVDRCRNTKGK